MTACVDGNDCTFELIAGGERVWPPPEILKRLHLLSLFQQRGHRTLVESGTYVGGTVEFFLPHASRIFTVELDPVLFQDATAKFATEPAVTVLHGDATEHIPRILADLHDPALVWLDGHYSGGVTARGAEDEPALTILAALGEQGLPAGSTIVVDDLRGFSDHADGLSLERLVGTARRAFPYARLRCQVDGLVIAA